jgi:hypothetical protein
MQLDFLRDGRVRLAVVQSAGADTPAEETYSIFVTNPGERPGSRS